MGVFSREQALASGLSRRMLAEALDTGKIRRIGHNAYAYASEPETIRLKLEAIQQDHKSSDAVAFLRTAADLHCIDVLPPSFDIEGWPIQLATASGMKAPIRPHCKGYQTPLGPNDVTELDGILVTTALRTAVDCGRLLPRLEAQAAVDQFVHRDPALLPGVLEQAELYRGRRGGRQLREVAALADPRVESPGESWTRVIAVHVAKLPIPEPQIKLLSSRGREWARIDNGYREYLVGFEYDGVEFHSSKEQIRADAARRAEIEGLGWVIDAVRSADVWSFPAEFALRLWANLLAHGYSPKHVPSEAEIVFNARARRRWRGSEYLPR